MNPKRIATILVLLVLILHIIGVFPHASATTFGANQTDHLALLAIKSKILQDPQLVTSSWNDSFHYCQWLGVTCGHRHKRVTVLDLSSRGLMGSLSPHIGNMSFLREIRLQNNTLGGRIPPEVGRLFRLQKLHLHNNSFEGEIPANISKCTNLTSLVLGKNNLNGTIPKEFTSLFMLKVLSIWGSNLSGEFPPFIGNLTSLKYLDVSNCQHRGSIPNIFYKLRNLSVLVLQDNHLIGTIPSSLYNLSMLEKLSLTGNRLKGSLPTSLGFMLPNLQLLYLSGNQFTGFLPPSLSNLSELYELDLEVNNFYGKVGIDFGNLQNLKLLLLGGNNLGSGEQDEMKFIDSLSNCSYLQTLDIVRNKFRGMLPNSLGNFSVQFEYLDLSQNSLYGSLPSVIGNLFGLTLLCLDQNQFTHAIPKTIANLKKLEVFHLHENDFSGEIPESLGNLSLLIQLGMAYNKLEGSIPSSLGNCSNLQFLSLYQNNLTGRIPKHVFELSSLSVMLSLGRNHLFGPLPVEVGSLKNLGQLSLRENYLSGELPSSLGGCTSLEFLDLSSNSFQGFILSSVGSLRALLVLNLSHNNFSGPIPRIFEEKSLENLDISFNDFEGEVPEIGVFANLSEVSVVGNHRLCGGMPILELRKCRMKDSRGRRKWSIALKIVIPVASVLVLLAMVSIFLFCCRPKKRKDQPSGLELKESFLKVSYEKLLKATNGFSSESLIGVGAFASVYKGVFSEDGVIVAVKVLNLQHRGGFKSFITECEALRHIRHRNLVKVITSCSSVDFQGNDFKAIVYEYMPNGTLDRWLHSSSRTEDEVPQHTLLQRLCIAMVSFFLFCCCTKKRKAQPSGLELKHSFLKVSYENLLKATNGFSSENLIGVGGFASVYKGVLDEDLIVAVKVLNLQHRGGFKSFVREGEALRHVRHRNLVKVITSCSSVDFKGNDFRALVYEYMPNGTLERWLHSSSRTEDEVPQLTLLQTLCIAIDVACALDYLHHHSGTPIIHCDLKPSNILLDSDMVAHVGDFGISKFLLPELSVSNPSSTTGIRGTIGYAPPEYGLGNDVSKNGDIYSYGIVLLEMVTARKPTDSMFQDGLNLHRWASMALANSEMNIVEPILLNDQTRECLLSMLKIGVECSQESPQDRLDISHVMQELQSLRGTIPSY